MPALTLHPALPPGQRLTPSLPACLLQVYFCSTAYGAALCRSIALRLSDSPNLKVLVTSRALPVQPYLRRIGEVPLQYSFTLRGLGYVYVKAHQHVPLDLAARFQCGGGACWEPGLGVPRLACAVDDPLVLDSKSIPLNPECWQ
jgi:hypothetical protein